MNNLVWHPISIPLGILGLALLGLGIQSRGLVRRYDHNAPVNVKFVGAFCLALSIITYGLNA